MLKAKLSCVALITATEVKRSLCTYDNGNAVSALLAGEAIRLDLDKTLTICLTARGDGGHPVQSDLQHIIAGHKTYMVMK